MLGHEKLENISGVDEQVQSHSAASIATRNKHRYVTRLEASNIPHGRNNNFAAQNVINNAELDRSHNVKTRQENAIMSVYNLTEDPWGFKSVFYDLN